ncbi:hypothetical protein R6Z07_003628 [Ovis aries]
MLAPQGAQSSGAQRAPSEQLAVCAVERSLREWWSWERWARAGSPLVAESLPGPSGPPAGPRRVCRATAVPAPEPPPQQRVPVSPAGACPSCSALPGCVLPAVLLGTLVFSSRLVATVPTYQFCVVMMFLVSVTVHREIIGTEMFHMGNALLMAQTLFGPGKGGRAFPPGAPAVFVTAFPSDFLPRLPYRYKGFRDAKRNLTFVCGKPLAERLGFIIAFEVKQKLFTP